MLNQTNYTFKNYALNFITVFTAMLLALFAYQLTLKNDQKLKEKQLITSLLEDLKADAADLQKVISYDSLRITDLEDLVKMKNTNLALPANKIKFYDRVYFCFSNMILHIPHNGSFIQLDNQSGYALIRNRNIVDSLIDYESGKHLIKDQEEFYKITLLKIYDLKYDLVDETIYDDASKFDKEKGVFLPKANPYLNLDKVKLIKFFNIARDYKKETRLYYKIILKNHLNLSLNLINMIKKEYDLD
jgi:hypothetical protein